MSKDNNNTVRFRVYQRKEDHTAFLWDSHMLNSNQKENIEISFTDVDDIEKKVKFRLASSTEIREQDLPSSLVMAIIGHEENGIDPTESYFAKLVLGTGTDVIEVSKNILPAGILPAAECDNKFRNVHMYAFNFKINKWQKCEGAYNKEGRFGLLVVME